MSCHSSASVLLREVIQLAGRPILLADLPAVAALARIDVVRPSRRAPQEPDERARDARVQQRVEDNVLRLLSGAVSRRSPPALAASGGARATLRAELGAPSSAPRWSESCRRRGVAK